VYGSGADDRVATIFPDKYRDMDDHSQSDSIFTRVLRQKEYELHDHLGNVRVRYSDMKRTTVAAGAPPYVIDQRGYANYYPFGMEQPGRSFSFVDEKGRYGYNGKEKDDDWNNQNLAWISICLCTQM